jgi:type II secretory pathway pseudopilin PulG
MNAFMFDRQRKASQLGFTLVEFIVAFAVAAMIMVGTMTILRYGVVTSAENTHRTMAQIEAYYVGFWIGEDVVQATGNITVGNTTWVWGNTTTTIVGFPITIPGKDGNIIIYELQKVYDPSNLDTVETEINGTIGRPWGRLVRTDALGSVTVGEHIIPSSLLVLEETDKGVTGTKCEPKGEGNETTLWVQVSAKVDRGYASYSWEIKPRVSGVQVVVWKEGT